MPLLAVLPFAFEEAHVYPPCWSLMLLLFTPQTETAHFSYFHLACISESNFDSSFADYLGPFLLG